MGRKICLLSCKYAFCSVKYSGIRLDYRSARDFLLCRARHGEYGKYQNKDNYDKTR